MGRPRSLEGAPRPRGRRDESGGSQRPKITAMTFAFSHSPPRVPLGPAVLLPSQIFSSLSMLAAAAAAATGLLVPVSLGTRKTADTGWRPSIFGDHRFFDRIGAESRGDFPRSVIFGDPRLRGVLEDSARSLAGFVSAFVFSRMHGGIVGTKMAAAVDYG